MHHPGAAVICYTERSLIISHMGHGRKSAMLRRIPSKRSPPHGNSGLTLWILRRDHAKMCFSMAEQAHNALQKHFSSITISTAEFSQGTQNDHGYYFKRRGSISGLLCSTVILFKNRFHFWSQIIFFLFDFITLTKRQN